jgi:hypothetical protein
LEAAGCMVLQRPIAKPRAFESLFCRQRGMFAPWRPFSRYSRAPYMGGPCCFLKVAQSAGFAGIDDCTRVGRATHGAGIVCLAAFGNLLCSLGLAVLTLKLPQSIPNMTWGATQCEMVAIIQNP